ncbi:hypothetical protein IEQ34_018368 [Dendrobium chrysotoxum]|uniref:Uncharacterized protein n=1 Tax=Dendrobium chrysotoxum TaxID=161865 RepID=A0AAV7GDP4_DENCH|nr:hypothetical protein IEQ34_018192 [Dendrobium chrysotoxum]KAH0454044.1 hypothetical protein IEQ34_018368 [Dendrobium chrysotoxum]
MMMVSKRSDPSFLDCNNPSKSFKDVVSSFDSLNAFLDLKVTTLRGLKALWISEEEVKHLARPFEFVLVRKFPMHRHVLDSIQKFFFNLKLSGDFFITLLDQ